MSILKLYQDVASNLLKQRPKFLKQSNTSLRTLDTDINTLDQLTKTAHKNTSNKNKANDAVKSLLSTPVSSKAKDYTSQQIRNTHYSMIMPYLVVLFIIVVIFDCTTAISTPTTHSLTKYYNDDITLPIKSLEAYLSIDGFMTTFDTIINENDFKFRLYSNSVLDVTGMIWKDILVLNEGFQSNLSDRFEIYDLKSLVLVGFISLVSLFGLF